MLILNKKLGPHNLRTFLDTIVENWKAGAYLAA
jgi:hypothetical protein